MVSSFFSTDDKLLFHTFLQGLDVCLSHLHETYYENVTNERPSFHSNIIQFTFFSISMLFSGEIHVLSYLRLCST